MLSATELGFRFALLVVFAAAVASKLSSAQRWRDFTRAVADLSGLGQSGALAVVSAELATTSLLLIAPPIGYALAVVLLAAFGAAMARALSRGREVACRCFGASAGPISPASLTRNGVLVAFAVAGLCLGRLASSPTAPAETRALAIGFGALIGLALTRWEDLAFAVAPRSGKTLKERRT